MKILNFPSLFLFLSLLFASLLIVGCGGGGGSSAPGPTITLIGPSELNLYIKSDYVEPGASAVDIFDNAVDVVITGEVNNQVAGSYTRIYRATDSSGRSSTMQRTVNVLDERIANENCAPPAPVGADLGTVSLTASFPSLPFMGAPLALVQPKNDSTFWMVATRDGRVLRFANDENVNAYDTVLDISSRVTTELEFGLTGLAIHPNYPQDPRVFLVYNDSQNQGRSTLSSFSVNTTSGIIDGASENVLLTLPQPARNHNGGDIAFDDENYLYVSFGDGGLDRDESQDLSTLHGNILRLDVSGADYTIPEDNPFNAGQASCPEGSSANGNCPEIYAYGFRNPWRFSFDTLTGDLWVADVGEATYEEVNRVVAGGNYGWPIMEANSCFLDPQCDTNGLELPITQYGRDTGVSTVGGYVYRGTRSPSLGGQYIWGDTFSQQFLSISATAEAGSTATPIFSSGRIIGALGQGNDGEVHLLSLNGSTGDEILRVTAEGGTTTIEMPQSLSSVGCFNPQEKTYTAGVFNYQVNSQLWSDSASKDRAFAIPNEATIDLSENNFIFPENSVLIKHFLDGDEYLETRFFIRSSSGWLGYSYEWNDEQTDAQLLAEGKTEDRGTFVHTYPSRAQCATCHTAAANFSLGLESGQLNRVGPVATNNQLELFSDIGLLTTPVDPETAPKLASLDDETATVEARARSYLHSNCAGCHQPGAQGGFMDLRYSTALNAMQACDVAPAQGDLGIADALIIAPGDPARSVLLARMQSLDATRMPPLASLSVHTEAVAVIGQWITGLADCQ